jgi:Zn-dependent protease
VWSARKLPMPCSDTSPGRAGSGYTLYPLVEFDAATVIIAFLVLLFSLTIHEAAHAWSASRLGDDTARRLGRVSLNPVVHIDPIGTVLLPLIALTSGSGMIFGWAKPTPITVGNLGQPRRDSVLVTAAGPASNLAIAVVATMLFQRSDGVMRLIAFEALTLNVLLAVFNMLPIPPLDGGQILMALLPPRISVQLRFLYQYGFLILMGLMFSGILSHLIGPPYYLILSWLR